MILFLCAAAAAAHGSQVADSATVRIVVTREAEPVAGAVVRLLPPGSGELVTGPTGRVVFRLPVIGTWRFAVSAIGYSPDTISVTLATPVTDTMVSVALEAEAAELEALVVESGRTNRRVEDQALRVELLAREEIEEKLLMTPGDISMMMNETGGLRVQTTSPSLGGAMVRVQGLRGRYTLLLADGLPLYGGQAGSLSLLQIPPMDLGKIEIIKGASSALYGSSALGGVINLLSRAAPPHGEAPERELLLNATTQGGLDAVLWTAAPLGEETGFTLLAGGHRQSRKDKDGDGWTDVPGYGRLVLRPRLTWSDAAGRSLFLTAGASVEERDGGTLDGEVAPDGAPYFESLGTDRFDGGAVLRLPLASQTLAVVRASGMTQGHEHQFGPVAEPDRHTTWFTEATVSRELGRSLIVLGAAYQGERYRSEAFPTFDYDYSVPGLFAHAEVVTSDRFSLALSARLDHHSRYGTFLNPRVSVLVTPKPGWSVRASAGSGYYAPTPFTEETEVTGLSRLAPLGDLVAERARSASIDLQRTAGSFDVTATLFASRVTDALQTRVDAAGATLINAAGPTSTHGVDLVGRFRRGPFVVTGSYTWTDATEPDPETGVDRTVPLTPRHAAGLVTVYEKEGRTRAGLELYYTGEQSLEDQTYEATSRDYLIVGLLAEQRVGAAKLFVNLENLGGVRQTRYAPLVRPTQAPDGRWTTDAWGPLEGRVINGGVRLEF